LPTKKERERKLGVEKEGERMPWGNAVQLKEAKRKEKRWKAKGERKEGRKKRSKVE